MLIEVDTRESCVDSCGELCLETYSGLESWCLPKQFSLVDIIEEFRGGGKLGGVGRNERGVEALEAFSEVIFCSSSISLVLGVKEGGLSGGGEGRI